MISDDNPDTHPQFMERYKGYKVPISAVKVGSLLSKLNAIEQRALAGAIENAATDKLADAEAADAEASADPTDLLAALDKAIGLTESEDAIKEAAAAEEEASEDAEDDESVKPARKGRKPRKTLLALEEAEGGDAKLQNSFIDLTKLLPALPKKGSFEVSTIKKSLYFFS